MIKVHHIYLLLIFCLCLFVKGFSQEEKPSMGTKVTVHTGAIVPHRPLVNEVIEGKTMAYELSFYKKTTGKKQWQQLYNYPKLGVSVLAINFGNDEELGMGFGVFPYIAFPLNNRKINWQLKIGYGLGYIQKPFDRTTNYKNITIGSHYNAIVYANMGWSIQLSNALSTSAGLSFIHFSNGSYARPNLGLNTFSLNTGLAYSFGKKVPVVTNQIEERPHVWSKKVMVGIGIKEIPPVDGPKYFVSSYSFNLMKTRAQKSAFGFGADVFYNSSLADLKAQDTNTTASGTDNLRMGIVGIYSFDFGNISFMIEMGGYVFDQYKGDGFIYHRFTTRFNVSDKLFLNLSMKTHFAVADFIEYGIGYNL